MSDRQSMEISADDPSPAADIHALFCHYNALYFQDTLGACTVSWSSSPPMDRSSGICEYHPDGVCEIRLSELLLKCRPTADLKNILLHEMIHAFLCIQDMNMDHSDHGSNFNDMMDAINSSSVSDSEKPMDGYSITIYHGCHDGVQQWNCGCCEDPGENAMVRVSCNCVGEIGYDGCCDNPSYCGHSREKLNWDDKTKEEELTGPKEMSSNPKGENEHHKDKFEDLQHTRATGTSCKTDGVDEKLDDKRVITITDFFAPDDAGNRNQGSTPSGDVPRSKFDSEDSNPAVPTNRRSAPAPKRKRSVSKKNHRYSDLKRRNCSKRHDYSVIIKWLDVFTDEEAEEDPEPLINKRSERRKKRKLLKDLREQTLQNQVKTEEQMSPSHLPVRENIIDISDG